MNDKTRACLTVWNSPAFKYIIMTVCAMAVLHFLRKVAREFTDCGKCDIPNGVKAAGAFVAQKAVQKAMKSY